MNSLQKIKIIKNLLITLFFTIALASCGVDVSNFVDDTKKDDIKKDDDKDDKDDDKDDKVQLDPIIDFGHVDVGSIRMPAPFELAVDAGELWTYEEDEDRATSWLAYKADPELYADLLKTIRYDGTEGSVDLSTAILYKRYNFTSQSTFRVLGSDVINKETLYEVPIPSPDIVAFKTTDNSVHDTHYNYARSKGPPHRAFKKKYIYGDITRGNLAYIKKAQDTLITAQSTEQVYTGDLMGGAFSSKTTKIGAVNFTVRFDGTATPLVHMAQTTFPNYWGGPTTGFIRLAFLIKTETVAVPGSINAQALETDGSLKPGVHLYRASTTSPHIAAGTMYQSKLIFAGPNLEEMGLSLFINYGGTGSKPFILTAVATKKAIYDAALAIE